MYVRHCSNDSARINQNPITRKKTTSTFNIKSPENTGRETQNVYHKSNIGIRRIRRLANFPQ